MKRNILYGIRGTLLKYMTLTSIVPLIVCLLVFFLLSRAALVSMAKQTMMNATINIARLGALQSQDVDRKNDDERDRGKNAGAPDAGSPAPQSAVFDMIRESKIAEKGYVFVADSQGRFVEHPQWKGRSLHQIIDRNTGKKLSDLINENRGNFIEYTISVEGEDFSRKLAYITYYAPRDWNIVATAEYGDILGSLETAFFLFIVILVVLPFVLLFAANFMALRISNPFRTIIDTAVKVTDGDLRVFIPQKHYVKCAQVKKCTKKDCPAFDSRNLACWSIEGSVLDEQGRPLSEKEKIGKYCVDCKVYNAAIRSETDELIEAINKMIVTMQRIMREIKITAEEINGDADILARTSSLLQEESETQAASIEETVSSNEELVATIENVSTASKVQADKMSQTSAAMEELTASTRTVGENSISLSREAVKMVDEAKRTEEMLQRTINNIRQIEESSRKIGDIIAIINDISDQINLLSLNAAIESARAGEHGKGFAVVAEEISKLADATAHSTKEIESLISTSGADIKTGATLVNNTADAITVMIKKIEAAAALIGDIASASEEQIRNSEQVMGDVEDVNKMSLQIAQANDEQKQTSAEILKAVSLINESLQKVANSSTDVSTSAAAMNERAHRLHSIVGRFIVKE